MRILIEESNVKFIKNIIDPKKIKFMQRSIKNQIGEYTVLENAKALKSGRLSPNDLPKIRICKDSKGNLWTLDHRRLDAFRLANLNSVAFVWYTEDEVEKQM